MTQKMFCRLVGFIFLIIAILHLWRVFSGWEAVIGGVTIPLWVSYLAIVGAGLLSWQGFKNSK